MDTVCFFNNKGGVGKTTLLCNVAAYIAKHHKLRVILVDSDPQCNATQLVLSEDQLTNLYRKNPDYSTILDVLRPLSRGEPTVEGKFSAFGEESTRFKFDLLAGHPRLALLEDRLSQSWLGFTSGDLGGARQTNWATQLVGHLSKSYDIAFFDVGPSLGALNRTVLVGTNSFVTPMSCDIFSIAGIENISTWLKDWLATYKRALKECVSKGWESEFKSTKIRTDVDEIARFIGYTVQQYIAKREGGKRRPTYQFEKIRQRVPKAAEKSLAPFLASYLDTDNMDLGDVPNMYSLIPMAQTAHAPIHDLQSIDGLVGAQYSQRDDYVGFVESLAASLLNNLNYDISKAAL